MGLGIFGKSMMGRDAFYKFLDREGYKLKRPKPRHTTNSNHRYHKYKNLIKEFTPLAPNQLWVNDITYIPLSGGKSCYLHLVTDAYSHKIIGWCLSDSLEAKNTLEALQMAIKQAENCDLSHLIHHSDRGVQYCCNMYIEALESIGAQISMTEDSKPTDNGIAERVNGTIKTEKIYRQHPYENIEEARQDISEFIDFYNEKRPHMSIGYQTPSKAHQQTGPQEKKWKGWTPKPSSEAAAAASEDPSSTKSDNCQQN